eukprot:6213120-Pleurochrysis_carterae.AAC.6
MQGAGGCATSSVQQCDVRRDDLTPPRPTLQFGRRLATHCRPPLIILENDEAARLRISTESAHITYPKRQY